MLLTGGPLYFSLAILVLWFGLLVAICWRSIQRGAQVLTIRRRLTTAGILSSAVAVGSILCLHLTWTSPHISQRFGLATVIGLELTVLLGAFAGFVLSLIGAGRLRFLTLGTSLIAGAWLMILYTASVLGGPPLARYPTTYFLPGGYVGWVEVRYGRVAAPPLALANGAILCKIPQSGILETSSAIDSGWATDRYAYYFKNGSTRDLRETGWGEGGMIWGSGTEWKDVTERTRANSSFFVGTEEQYNRDVASSKERRPFNQSLAKN